MDRRNPQAVHYRVLAPIESGNLLLFPVVRADGKSVAETPFITLDEGLKSGEVEVTEAGRARGLVRPRGDVIGVPPYNNGQDIEHPRPPRAEPQENYSRGDEVNTLVLVNHSKRPLLLLAGEIVTGGKQDRIIAKDRIVPADADPIDLSVFCIEPGRWTESSSTFGASAKSSAHSFMVQPTVRERAMVDAGPAAGVGFSAWSHLADGAGRGSAVVPSAAADRAIIASAEHHQLRQSDAERGRQRESG